MTGFPTRAPSDLEDRPPEQEWLVDGLWGRQAVGIIGGEPKCGKSFLALDLAVAVAAGVPCLRRFETDRPGPVLMFAAEDAGHIVRRRLQGIAAAAEADFQTLDIAVIDVPVLRLDHRNDRQRLEETVERIRPRPVVLDPLVRLHAVDENAVADIAPILGFLRDLQRRFDTKILIVHHSRKSGATRPGQALRGSSELHAFRNGAFDIKHRPSRSSGLARSLEHEAPSPAADRRPGHGQYRRLPWQKRETASSTQRREGSTIPDVSVARLSRPSVVGAAPKPMRRSRSARSANASRRGTRPSARSSGSSSAKDVLSATARAATA